MGLYSKIHSMLEQINPISRYRLKRVVRIMISLPNMLEISDLLIPLSRPIDFAYSSICGPMSFNSIETFLKIGGKSEKKSIFSGGTCKLHLTIPKISPSIIPVSMSFIVVGGGGTVGVTGFFHSHSSIVSTLYPNFFNFSILFTVFSHSSNLFLGLQLWP